MFVKFVSTWHKAIIETYEMNHSHGVEECDAVMHSIIGRSCFDTIRLQYTIEDCDVPLRSTLGAYDHEFTRFL